MNININSAIYDDNEYFDNEYSDKLLKIKPDTSQLDLSNYTNIIDYSKNIENYNSFLEYSNFRNTLDKQTKFEIIENINNIKDFILIIDFPNQGGGTTVFINNIVSKYKHQQNFLILRNYKNTVVFFINDEYMLAHIFTENTAFEFIKNNKNKINKIFINHTLCFTNNFINNLFTLDKHITTITHDYLYLLNNFSFLYTDEFTKELRKNIIINKFDCIITQNKQNLYYFKNYINTNKNIIITELPDFKKSKNIINTNNTNLIIGIIGLISDIKGKQILNKLLQYYTKNNNVRFIVFGEFVNNSANKNININYYNNIDEFNNLLTKYKPNILIELSICPETYSYTLTLGMLTNLPILFLNKNKQSVVENRLLNYDKAYGFDTIKEFNIIANKVKQNYFYTIDSTIYFGKFWDEYFVYNNQTTNIYSFNDINDKITNKNIVLITSKIYTSKNKYTYTNTRSIYSKNTRFKQTLNTIKSIRKYIKNSFIIIIDNSVFDKYEHETISDITDYFINNTNDNTLNYYTDVFPIKAYAEIAQQISFYNEFLQKIDLTKIKHFFKISGRYLINNTFNYNMYDNNKNIFKKNVDVTDRDYYYTSFYKLSNNILTEYFDKLKILFNVDDKDKTNIDFEVIVPNTIINKLTFIANLGITQYISIANIIDDI